MPTFKPKNNKKCILNPKSTTTLDNKHKEIIDNLKNEMSQIPILKKKKTNYQNYLNNNTEIKIEEKMNIIDEINEIKKTIKELKNKEKNYLLKNSQYVFEYFEEKKTICKGNNKTTLLDKFFNNNQANNENNNDNNNNNNSEINNLQKYLINIDETFLDINKFIIPTDICSYCKKGEMIPIEYEGILLCNNCNKIIKYLIENDKPSYKDPPKEVCFYAYKRINHFREILAQFQAKESTQIPDEIIENIKLQIKKERLDISQINNRRAKEILKNLGYNKYYEHIPFIKDRLGIKPPIMSPELEDTLCNLFTDIQGPYIKYCPDDRVNFLNYYYTIYKLCELLGQTVFLPFFPMLKDRVKRIEQDEIWKNICMDLDWEFIPTI